jgi:hypothetical protein
MMRRSNEKAQRRGQMPLPAGRQANPFSMVGKPLPTSSDAGVPVHVLRKIAGHGSLTTTQLYLHPDEQSITDAGDALSAHISARRSPNGPRLTAI